MASGEARALKRAYARAKIVVGDGQREFWSELFDGNSNLTRLADVRSGDDVVWLRNYFGCRPYLDYALSEANCRQVFKPYRAIAGDIISSETELARADVLLSERPRRDLPLVSIEPNVEFGPNKDWGFSRWQAVVDRLRDRVTFVQPSYGKPLLAGVHAIPSTFRCYCAVLTRCALHVGPEGGLHHAAAALRRPAVVVFGGRIHPRVTGYAGHASLYVDAPGSPCGMVAPCEHCQRCLESISVHTVVTHVRHRLAARAGTRVRAIPARSADTRPRARSHADGAARSPRA
jgi:hypothetical protein